MAKSERQKIKLLRLYEYLRMESDENHPRTMGEIIKELDSQGIKCERKSVYSDIALLREYGYDIRREGYKYYLATRELNLGQIRFLIDATQSAAFLTKEQTQEICAALSMLAGTHRAELLREHVICFDKNKHLNGEVLRTVEVINRAIDNDKKISFKYFHIGLNGEREYGKSGERYKRSPVGLTFNDGYYYLVCHSEKYGGLNTFRVDRICDVVECDDCITHRPIDEKFTNGTLKDEMTAFGMWHNAVEQVTLIFERAYIEDIYDKFGYGVRIGAYDADHYYISERVNLSDLFYGWVASYGEHIRISSPAYVKERFVEKLKKGLEQY